MGELLIYGSVALDSLRTPFGERERVLGGSGLYASLAAALFVKSSLFSAIGEDFPKEHLDLLKEQGVSLDFLVQVAGERTFFWRGYYEYDMNVAHTEETQLNVLAHPPPLGALPERWAPYGLLLANMDPEHQLAVLRRCQPKFVAADTMNLWIETKRGALLELLARCHLFFCNEGEARALTEEVNLLRAARQIQKMGPPSVVIKKGEHGALLLSEDRVFLLPAYPLETAQDPTGAGDSFAGAACGYLCYVKSLDDDALRRALLLGTVAASFTVSDFSVTGLLSLTQRELLARYLELRELTSVPELTL